MSVSAAGTPTLIIYDFPVFSSPAKKEPFYDLPARKTCVGFGVKRNFTWVDM